MNVIQFFPLKKKNSLISLGFSFLHSSQANINAIYNNIKFRKIQTQTLTAFLSLEFSHFLSLPKGGSIFLLLYLALLGLKKKISLLVKRYFLDVVVHHTTFSILILEK
jgi:hypothetical protein